MDRTTIILLTGLIFIAALLYSSVGHAGASGYLAAMALFGVAPAVMKPTALTLNVLVAVIASINTVPVASRGPYFGRSQSVRYRLRSSAAVSQYPAPGTGQLLG